MKSTIEIPYSLLHWVSWCLLKAGFALQVHGMEHLKKIDGPIILAGNHAGFLDSLILMAACKRSFHFLMDEKVFGWGWVGKLVRYGNILPINPLKSKASMRCAIHALRKGASICIFPEGKLSLDGQLGKFQEGVAFLQEKSEATILPFAITGSFEAWPHERRFPRLHPIRLIFGEPIPCEMIADRAEVTNLLRGRISEMLSPFEQRGKVCKPKHPSSVFS
jgi:1-acyl-sn-glycerol-3-phosphate acyltransferase